MLDWKGGFTGIGLEKVMVETVLLKKRLNDIGAQTFLMAGTLLGAIRDDGLIEHDKDVDLGVLDEEVLYLIANKLGPEYDRVTWSGFDVPAGKTLWLWRHFKNEGGDWAIPFEFQCHYFQKDVAFYNRKMDKTWKCYETHVEYPIKLFRELKEIDFLGERWLAPNPPKEWLDVFYGPDWETPKKYSDWRYNCPIFLSGYMTSTGLVHE